MFILEILTSLSEPYAVLYLTLYWYGILFYDSIFECGKFLWLAKLLQKHFELKNLMEK